MRKGLDKKARRWVKSAVAAIEDGRWTMETIAKAPATQIAAVEAALARNAREAERISTSVSVAGRVIRSTAKAVLFKVARVQHGDFIDAERLPGEMWLPRSQVGISERVWGPLDEALIPRWLFDEKVLG